MRGAVLAGLAFLAAGAAHAGCGTEEAACEIEQGSYHAVLPEGAPKGALVFLHGWGSSGAGSLRMTGMVSAFTEAGYVVLAPNGTPREGRKGLRWNFHPDWPAQRDEHIFLRDVRDDAAARFGFAPERALLSGFSIGGSMAAYVACLNPTVFAAYAPVGGNLWRPHPESCAGPVKMFHTHGWRDGTVPLEGRVLRGGSLQDEDALIQGDAWAAMEIWRVANGCVNHKPDRMDVGERYWTRAWDDCADGSTLEFALHAGGHSMPKGWSQMALDWFETQLVSH